MRRDGTVHRDDLMAVRVLQEQGVFVTLCTGRMYSGTRALVKELGIVGPVACIDGSYIVDATTGSVIQSISLGLSALAAALSVIRALPLASFVFSADRLYYDRSGDDFVSYMRGWTPDLVRRRDVLDLSCWNASGAVEGVACLGERAVISDAVDQLRLQAGGAMQVLGFPLPFGSEPRPWGLVLRAADATKATAVEWLVRHYGLQLREVVAVGDWLNDIPMLRIAGRSFAMSQAPTEVSAAATDRLVAGDRGGGGLLEAARRSGLL